MRRAAQAARSERSTGLTVAWIARAADVQRERARLAREHRDELARADRRALGGDVGVVVLLAGAALEVQAPHDERQVGERVEDARRAPGGTAMTWTTSSTSAPDARRLSATRRSVVGAEQHLGSHDVDVAERRRGDVRDVAAGARAGRRARSPPRTPRRGRGSRRAAVRSRHEHRAQGAPRAQVLERALGLLQRAQRLHEVVDGRCGRRGTGRSRRRCRRARSRAIRAAGARDQRICRRHANGAARDAHEHHAPAGAGHGHGLLVGAAEPTHWITTSARRRRSARGRAPRVVVGATASRRRARGPAPACAASG